MTRLPVAALVLAAVLPLPSQALAERPSWSLQVTVDAVSSYVWRGIVLADDPALQTLVLGSRGGLTLSAWTSVQRVVDVKDGAPDGDWRLNELDLQVGYARSVGVVTLGADVLTYVIEDTPTTTELHGRVAVDTAATFALDAWRDLDETGGLYLQLSVSRAFEVTPKTCLMPMACLGWNDRTTNEAYYGVPRSSLADGTLCLSVSHQLTSSLALTGSLRKSWLVDRDVREASEGHPPAVAAAGLAWTF